MFPSAAYIRTLATKCCHNGGKAESGLEHIPAPGSWATRQRRTEGLQQGVNPEVQVLERRRNNDFTGIYNELHDSGETIARFCRSLVV